LYDLDAGFLEVNDEMLVHTTKNDSSVFWPNSPSSTFLFRNLLKSASFQTQFINRYAEILNLNFDVEIMKNKLDSIKNNGSFMLFNNYLDIKNVTITITNISGQIIYNENNVDIIKNEAKHFDLPNLSNNLYVLQIISDNYSGQKKIMIID